MNVDVHVKMIFFVLAAEGGVDLRFDEEGGDEDTSATIST
jgi:hypothetical protein